MCVFHLDMNEGDVSFLLCQSRPDGNLRLIALDGLVEFHGESRCHPRGLQLACHHPTCRLVDERADDASMQHAHPSLVMLLWYPEADDALIFVS